MTTGVGLPPSEYEKIEPKKANLNWFRKKDNFQVFIYMTAMCLVFIIAMVYIYRSGMLKSSDYIEEKMVPAHVTTKWAAGEEDVIQVAFKDPLRNETVRFIITEEYFGEVEDPQNGDCVMVWVSATTTYYHPRRHRNIARCE